MDRSARFWDRLAERYSRRPIADQASYEKKLRDTQERFRPDMEVLEFGCGTGGTALLHAPHVKHILAIDISSKMIEIAKGKARDADIGNVTFETVGIEGFDGSPGSFDAVLGLSILHLLEDKDEAIARVYELLRPGGLFVTSTVCLADSMKWLRYVVPIGRAVGLMPLVKVFTSRELLDSLTRAGFAIDHEWHPGEGKAIFVIAKKAG